jgi:hypothetical protein
LTASLVAKGREKNAAVSKICPPPEACGLSEIRRLPFGNHWPQKTRNKAGLFI